MALYFLYSLPFISWFRLNCLTVLPAFNERIQNLPLLGWIINLQTLFYFIFTTSYFVDFDFVLPKRAKRTTTIYSGVQHILYCVSVLFVFRLVYPMLPVSLDCPFLFTSSVFSVTFIKLIWLCILLQSKHYLFYILYMKIYSDWIELNEITTNVHVEIPPPCKFNVLSL